MAGSSGTATKKGIFINQSRNENITGKDIFFGFGICALGGRGGLSFNQAGEAGVCLANLFKVYEAEVRQEQLHQWQASWPVEACRSGWPWHAGRRGVLTAILP